ncbi:MAG TPA: AAA family ATPase [Chloroflexota bacterium]|nr:AAA family ATPase [Chloroflexota bacterium]
MSTTSASKLDGVMVGRTHESGTILRQLESASLGTTRVVLLAGEPGIGKSRLLDWLASRVSGDKATVLRGAAFQAEGMPPYLPLLEAFGWYIRGAEPDRLRQQVGDAASTLALLLPDLTSRLGGVPPSYGLPPEQARLRLFDAVGTFLSAIAASRPVVLLLDDLQWSDRSTLDLLCYVTRTHASSRVLVVGAYRDDEAMENEALQWALTELNRQRCVTVVRVGPLAPAEVETLASQCLGASSGARLTELLYEQSEGNPFFVEELLEDWLETGKLVRQGESWTLAATARHSVPPSIIAAVSQRLNRVQREVVDDLRVASVIGRTFPVWLLTATLGESAEAVEDRLLQAARARLIESAGDGTHRFRHDVIRECFYAQMTDTRRQRLHERIGLALEGQGNGTRLADLAFHFACSGDRERAVTYSRRAGDEALRHSALEEALAHYETALGLLDPDDERRGDVLLHAGDAALLAGKEEVAATSFETALGLLTPHDPAGAARAARGLGLTRLRQDAVFEARLAFEAALTLLGERSSPETVRVLVDFATVLTVNLGRQQEGVVRARQALEMARQLGEKQLEGAAARAAGNLQVRGNRMADGMDLLRDALVLARTTDDPAEAAECCACLANASYWCADLEGSRAYTVLREECARRCQQPYELRHIHSWLAFLAATQGDWERAERLLAQARPVVERLSSGEPLGFVYQVEGFLAWEQGRLARAERRFEMAVAAFREHSPDQLVWYLGPLGLAQLAVGKRRGAEGTLAELDLLVTAQAPGSLPTAPALNCAVLIALRMGDRERADSYYSRLGAFEGQLHWFLVDRSLAAFEWTYGDRDAARRHLDHAERLARRGGMRQVLAGILDDRDRFVLAEPSATLPAGLSSREAEVLGLVTAGLSNREIAGRLHLSEHTVAKHLTSIFNKTGTDNRAAAAAFAIRNGLPD